jgi:hypothetical protein
LAPDTSSTFASRTTTELDRFRRSDAKLYTLSFGGDESVASVHVVTVCVFTPGAAPRFEFRASDDLPPTLDIDGDECRRYRISRLVNAHEVEEAVVYCAEPPTPREELELFRTVFPGRGGVFRVDADG